MLENYFQNSRRYVKSLDSFQLIGLKPKSDDELTKDCEPFRYSKIESNDGGGESIKKYTRIEPCGSIANSIFNGELILFVFIDLSQDED